MQIRRILLALLLTAVLMFPVILISRPFAATIEPRATGGPFPGETSCAKSGCHDSSPVNAGPGGVSVLIDGDPASEFQYRPGETVPVTVRVADPAGARWGFQLSTRPPDGCTQAGTLAPANGDVAVISDAGMFSPCTLSTIDFAVHRVAKFGGSEATFTVNWTAPSSDIGPVVFAAAGNAANGNNFPTGDNIYTVQETVEAAEGGGGGPTIAAGGIVDAAQFQPSLSRRYWLDLWFEPGGWHCRCERYTIADGGRGSPSRRQWCSRAPVFRLARPVQLSNAIRSPSVGPGRGPRDP